MWASCYVGGDVGMCGHVLLIVAQCSMHTDNTETHVVPLFIKLCLVNIHLPLLCFARPPNPVVLFLSVAVLREAGQSRLAYACAVVHGLDDMAEALKAELGDKWWVCLLIFVSLHV